MTMWNRWIDDTSVLYFSDSEAVTHDLIDGHTERQSYPFDSESAFGVISSRHDAENLARECGYQWDGVRDSLPGELATESERTHAEHAYERRESEDRRADDMTAYLDEVKAAASMSDW